MSIQNRYFFYTIVFALVVASVITKSYLLFGLSLVAGIAIGFITELYDNKRDEKFKHYNAKHQYKH
ncbi:hypothetical protein [Tumebacillus permanentifrigoris]|uniref:Uncharacterized protein n=1 Tax=Tumebacillus permanentifrigoris TaxID=378543 RepID=A0A316D426_9BACL|nr:hypothetical protein [Tumebacillus permanentifrigoris]PWK06977.1 hypothetical protein C7459_11841 [Tumebacillus permanentifrigoris]